MQIGIGVGGIVVLGVVIWLVVGLLSRFDVTVNGQKVTLSKGATIQTLLDNKTVSPKPGNLVAIDGTTLTEGGGNVCSATVDGNKADTNTVLTANNVVEIGDGEDATENTTVDEKEIPFETESGDRSFEAYWFGSIHLLSDGVNGIERTTTGEVSGKTETEVTKEPISKGYRIYTAQPEDKLVALTFDDGPWPETTDQILDILEQNGAKATFFTIGNQISSNKDALVRAHKLGCEVCTHTWDHAEGSGGGTSIANMSATEQVTEVEKGYKAIADALGEEPPHIIRAPGGNFYGDVIDNLWGKVDAEIGWDVDTEDWSKPGESAIEEMILSVKPGQVVLMHDGGGDRSQTVQALRNALPKLVEKGYKFVTVSDLIDLGMPSKKSDIPSTTGESTSSSSTSGSFETSSSSSSSSSGSNGSSESSSSSSSSSSTSSSSKSSSDTYGSTSSSSSSSNSSAS